MEKKGIKEKIILGLDPGTNVMGYGVIMVEGKGPRVLQFGVIQLDKYESHELRLKKIFERVLALVDDFNPDEVALEAPFYGKNVQSMLKLGRATDGSVWIDSTGKRSGRGAYLCQSPDCWRPALQRGLLQRALKIDAIQEDDLQRLTAALTE